MLYRHHAYAFALLATTALAIPGSVHAAACKPGTGSDSSSNTCIGASTLGKNTTGSSNTAIGASALKANTTGFSNTALGDGALSGNATGEFNIAIGKDSLSGKNTGGQNIAIGVSSLLLNTSGADNTALGFSSMVNNSTGSQNVAIGELALVTNSTGDQNVAIGEFSLDANTTGSNNVALGYQAGSNLTTGSNNIAIGNVGVAADANTIRIGTQGTQKKTLIAGIRGTTITSGQTVVVNANGQLGVISSSRRYKDDILPMGDASNALMQLRPITFHYKQADENGHKPLQYGLIAEEVEKIIPDLVVYNADGTPESVAYQVLPSLLLNEYQKQNRELVATKAKLDSMQSEFETLKLVVSRLATAPTVVRVTATAP